MATPEQHQLVHHGVLSHFVETGRAPHFTDLAAKLDVKPDQALRLLHETVTECPFLFAWMTPNTDFVAAWAPFSNLPNPNPVSVDGIQKWYAQ